MLQGDLSIFGVTSSPTWLGKAVDEASSLRVNPFLDDGDVNGSNSSGLSSTMSTIRDGQRPSHVFGDVLFAYISPFLISLGLIGNVFSLVVFTIGPRSSKIARTQYLLCLGISDSIVLLSYVLPEWVKRGITTLDPTTKYLSNIVYDSWRCYTILFLSYSSRFISAWLRVLCTFERFFSIRFPFKRLSFGPGVTRAIILSTVVFGLVISSIKPLLMQDTISTHLPTESMLSSESYTANYDVDIKSLLTQSPSTEHWTRKLQMNNDLGDDTSTGAFISTQFGTSTSKIPQFIWLENISSPSTFLTDNTAKLIDLYGLETTTTQVDQKMLQALIQAFGNVQSTSNSMNSSELIDVMLGDPTPDPVCVVRPEWKRYGEVYDTLYFGVFIMLLPFVLIIIFDFNVLYVVRNRNIQLLMPIHSLGISAGAVAVRRGTQALGTTECPIQRSRQVSLGHHPPSSSFVPERLTVMLVLSSCFILLNLPYFIIWCIYSYFIQPGQAPSKPRFNEMPTDIFNNISFAARTISGLTYSVNGIIYLASDQAFRSDFIKLFKKCFLFRVRSTSSTSSSSRGAGNQSTGGTSRNRMYSNDSAPTRKNTEQVVTLGKSSLKRKSKDRKKNESSLPNGALKPNRQLSVEMLNTASSANSSPGLNRQRSVRFADESKPDPLTIKANPQVPANDKDLLTVSPRLSKTNAAVTVKYTCSELEKIKEPCDDRAKVDDISFQPPIDKSDQQLSQSKSHQPLSPRICEKYHKTNDSMALKDCANSPSMSTRSNSYRLRSNNAHQEKNLKGSATMVIYCELESCI